MNYKEDNYTEMYDLLINSIDKESVLKKDTRDINNCLKLLRKNLNKSANKIMITFDGYEMDEREIYEIDEIRKYVEILFQQNNDLFYYITDLDQNNKILLACMSNLEQVKRQNSDKVILKYQLNESLKNKIINNILLYSKGNKENCYRVIRKLFF